MPDETESAAAQWLESADTKRELSIISDRFPNWTEYERTSFALLIEVMVALNVYGEPVSIVDTTADPDVLQDLLDRTTEDDDDDEPWRGRLR